MTDGDEGKTRDGAGDALGMEDITNTKMCPACGKHIPKEDKRCPECAAEMKFRVKESTILKFSFFFLAVAVAFLLIHVLWEPPVTDVADLNTFDNYEIATFKGTVVNSPSYNPIKYQEYGEMKFYMDDGTGVIQVYCDSKVTEDLIKADKVPINGDEVEVTGRVLYIGSSYEFDRDLTIDRDGMHVYLKTGVDYHRTSAFTRVEVVYQENLVISRNKYVTKSISDVAGKPMGTFENGTKVVISGTVVSGLTNYTSRYQFSIGDPDTGDSLLVYIPKDLLELADVELYSDEDPVHRLTPTSEITIIGALQYYYNENNPQYSKWELIPTHMGDKLVAGKKCFDVTKGGEGFTVDLLMSNGGLFKDESVELRGVSLYKEGSTFYVKDSPSASQKIMLYVSDYFRKDHPDSIYDYEDGDLVDISGQFIKYDEDWEIKLSWDSHYIREVV